MSFRKIIKDSEGGQKYVTEQEEELVFDQSPTKGSFNPVTSDGVAKALSVGEGGAQIGDVVPPDTTAENPLVNEKALRELMLNTIGGRTYKTTKIGNQIWLAENLDFKFYGLKVGSSEVVSEGEPKAVYYNDDEATYGAKGNKYGLLYNWYAVEELNKYKDQLIPGWHVPTDAEWDALATAVGGASVAGTKLKSKIDWPSSKAGTDDYGFSALPAGYYNGSFESLGTNASFWTATEQSSIRAYNRNFETGKSMYSYYSSKTYAFSVRLVRDA